MTVVPSEFDQNPAKVRISGLGDGAAATPGTAGTLGGHETGVAHDLGGALETPERAEFGGEGDGGDLWRRRAETEEHRRWL